MILSPASSSQVPALLKTSPILPGSSWKNLMAFWTFSLTLLAKFLMSSTQEPMALPQTSPSQFAFSTIQPMTVFTTFASQVRTGPATFVMTVAMRVNTRRRAA